MTEYGIEKKNSFVVYHSWLKAMDILGEKSAWRIMKALWSTDLGEEVTDDFFENPAECALYQTMFGVVVANRKKYEKKCQRNAENGKKGGRPSKNEITKEENVQNEETEASKDNNDFQEFESVDFDFDALANEEPKNEDQYEDKVFPD